MVDARDAAKGWILVVDDDDAIRATLSDLVRGEGCHVVTSANGAHALDMLEKMPSRPALVLIDWMMPTMNGETLLAHLRERMLLDELAVVVFTAGRTRQVPGARRVPHKPFGVDELLEVIAEYATPPTLPSLPSEAPPRRTQRAP